ncbi:SGNH/GDSL hydrolase family protein [uncultured Fibrella sp.]|uniref:SGNH/GDSL hydrolase family protein n=1 Tax=uncultured Fibrella sp. TaxID=1284596 RepID=UPI0035CC0BB0
MNILILGSTQACGPGLPTGKSYVAQFARRLRSSRHPVEIDYRPVSMAEASRLLPKLRLSAYDLILLQFDSPLDWLPDKPVGRLMMRARLWLGSHRFAQLKTLREQLVKVLLQVRVCNRQVVLVSPLPHRKELEQQLVQLMRAVYVQESREWQVPFFDVSQHLSGGDELFQAGSADRLSTVAHELMGSELHTFITEPTYTLWP